MLHVCHATGCQTRVPPEKLFCRKHWRMVPQDIKERIVEHYRIGQCQDKRPSRDWLTAAKDAIRAVRDNEGFKLMWG